MPIKRQVQLDGSGQGGFTLIELMVVVAVVAILAVVAAPSMSALMNASKLNSASGELTAALQIARSEAIRRNSRVWVCATDGSVTNTTACSNSASWTKWAILDLTKNVAADRVIRNETSTGSVQIKSDLVGGVMFRPSGVINAQTKVTVCMPVTKPAENKREITVMISGVLTTAKVNGSGSC